MRDVICIYEMNRSIQPVKKLRQFKIIADFSILHSHDFAFKPLLISVS